MVIYWNKSAETMPRDALKKLQEKKLKALAKYVYDKVPMYNKRFKEMKLKPAS